MSNLPGALTRTSIALRDALLAVALPFIKRHPSNTFAREAFRRHSYLSDSYLSDIAVGYLFGFGVYGSELAIVAADRHVAVTEES